MSLLVCLGAQADVYPIRIALGGRLKGMPIGVWGHSTSPLSGNQVDRLPLDCHTETVAKPDRLGPAQNDKPMQHFVELSRFHSMKCIKTQRKPCQAYIEDQYERVKM